MKKTWIALTAIILLAASLRFYQLEIKMRFIWDEGRDMAAIYRIVAERNITLFGPYNEIGGSKDFFGVFHYYLMAPSLWLANYDPFGPALFTAGLGVVSVFLVYLLVRQWSNEKLAIATTFLYAISPVVIRYVQWSWNPNTTPFFGLLYLLVLTHFHRHARWRVASAIVAGFVLGLLFQLHFFTVVLGWVFLLMVLKQVGSIRHKLVLCLAFGFAFILPNLSFLVFDFTHDFFYWKILSASFASQSSQQLFEFSPIHFLTVPSFFTYSTLAELGAGMKLSFVLTPVFLLTSYRSISRYFQTKKLDLSFLVVSTFGCFLLMISFFPSLVDLYHLAYLWWGIWFVILFELSLWLKPKAWYLVLIIISAVTLFNLFTFINRPPDWSQNLPLVRSLSKVIADDLTKNPSSSINVAAFTDADTRALRYRYFLLKDGFEASGVDQYPNNEVIYIISPHDEPTTKRNPAWEIDSVRAIVWHELAREQGIFVFRAEK